MFITNINHVAISKFKPGVFLPLIAVFLLFGILISSLFYFTAQTRTYIIPVIVVPVCLFFMFWILKGELWNKAVKVSILNDRIKVSPFMGYGKAKELYFSEMEGYKISILPDEYRDYEFLYLIKAGRKVVKISEFYHANYRQLKMEITSKCKKLPSEKFSVLREWKDIWESGR